MRYNRFKFTRFVNDENSLNEFLYDFISPHVAIEVLFNSRKGGVLIEAAEDSYDIVSILESYGVFSGCEVLAKDIANFILDHPSLDNHIEITPKTISFFDILRIDFVDNNVWICYDPLNSLYDNDSGRFLEVRIICNRNLLSKRNSIIPKIMHELQHAYEDFMVRKNMQSFVEKNKKYGIDKIFMLRRDKNLLKSSVGNLFYFLYKPELNAYVAEIKGELDSYNGTFYKISDVLKFLKGTIPVVNYYGMCSFVSFLNDVESFDVKNDILCVANEISDEKFKTYDSFLKWINLKSQKIRKKLDTMLYKIVGEWASDRMVVVLPQVNETVKWFR